MPVVDGEGRADELRQARGLPTEAEKAAAARGPAAAVPATRTKADPAQLEAAQQAVGEALAKLPAPTA